MPIISTVKFSLKAICSKLSFLLVSSSILEKNLVNYGSRIKWKFAMMFWRASDESLLI